MKELGEKLSSLRKKTGITLEEASMDLSIDVDLLGAIENGNSKAFKDVYELKENIKTYSKYLGLDEKNIIEEFNDFIFEKTSKITLDDFKVKELDEEPKEKISSPYTKIKPSKYNLKPIAITVVSVLLFMSVVFLILTIIKNNTDVIRELNILGGRL